VKNLFTLLILLSFTGAYAQLDSLQRIWNDKNAADTLRLDALDEIAWYYVYSNPDTALVIANLELQHALKKKFTRIEAQSYNTHGVCYWIKGDYQKAITYYRKGLVLWKKMRNNHGISTTLSNIGLIYKDQGNYREALKYYNQALKNYQKKKDQQGIATTYNNMGVIYFELKQYEPALKYYKKSLTIRKKIKDKLGILSTICNMGGVYLEDGDTIAALASLDESYKLSLELDNDHSAATMLHNIGTIYYEKRDFATAATYHAKALALREKIGDKSGISSSLTYLAMAENRLGNTTSARARGEKALAIAKEIGDPFRIETATDFLHLFYKKTGLHKQSLEMYELYIATRDSLQSENNNRAAMQQRIQHEYDIKDAQNKASLKKQKALAAEEKKRQSIIILAVSIGLLLVIIFSVFLFNRFRVIRKQKEMIAIQKAEADLQRELVEEKNHEILDSINYAKRLQEAILPPGKLIKQWVHDHFILFKPKDIVSGDFYWFEKTDNHLYFAAVDCTGHGVPGAMVSVIGYNGLNRTLKEFNLRKPSEILDKLSSLVEETFEKSEQDVKDGMDIALCAIEFHVSGNKFQERQ
jgi:tetratricopeptide (TPR) repeat protein